MSGSEQPHERLTDTDRVALEQATKDAWSAADKAMEGYAPRFGYRPKEEKAELGSITLPLSWHPTFPGNPAFETRWTLRAGIFEIGEIWYSIAFWCWQLVGYEDKPHGTGYATLEEAQAGLVAAVKETLQ